MFIDTFSYVKDNPLVFVIISSSCNNRIKETILKKDKSLAAFNQKHMSIKNPAFIWGFKEKNRRHNLRRLLKIAEIIGIEEVDIRTAIEGYYAYGSKKAPISIPQRIALTSFFVEGYALYIGEGDTGESGIKKPRKLRFTNAEISVINFFISWIREYFPHLPFYIAKIQPEKAKDASKHICHDDIRQSTGKYCKKTKYRVCLDRAIIIDLILAIRDRVRKVIKKDEELAKAYLRGIMAAEGTVYNNRTRYVRLEMKNPSEMAFVRTLLDTLSLTYTKHSRTTRKNMESIYMGGRENLKRFYTIVGFGCQKERQRKLEKLVADIC